MPAVSAARRPGLLVCALALVVLTTVPLLATAVRLVPGWVPQGDDATIVLRGDDLFTSQTPLLGMPSTVGDAVDAPVHHPGPLESQAIGLVASVVDDPRVAVVVVTLVNLLSVLVVLLWAHHIGGLRLLALAGVVTAALLWSLRGPILVTPFNPYVAVLPFLACTVSLVAATELHRWAVTAAVLSGSWAAQAHLTTTGPVVAATAAAGVVAAVRWVGDRRAGRPSTTPDRSRLLVGVGALLACWAFPLIDVLTNEGGNVRAVLQASGSLEDETLGTGGAIDVLVQALAVRPVWAQAGAGPLDLLAPPSIVDQLSVGLLLAAAVALGWALRRRRPAVTATIVVVVASLVVGGVLTTRIPTAFFNTMALHNYLWLWPATAVLWAAVLAGTASLAGDRLPRRVPRSVAVALAAVVLALLGAASVATPHRPFDTASTAYVRSIAPQVAEALDPDGRYLIDLDGWITTYGVGTGLLFHLERAGYDVRVPERYATSFGENRVDGADGRDVLVVRIERTEPPPSGPSATEVASYDPPDHLVAARDAAEGALIREIRRQDGTEVPLRGRIAPADAGEWVRSGGLLDALRARLLDQTIADLPAARRLRILAERPVDHVAVHLLPACTTADGAGGCGG